MMLSLGEETKEDEVQNKINYTIIYALPSNPEKIFTKK